MASKPILKIVPPLLLRYMSPTDRKRSVLALDADAEIISGLSLRFNLDVVFQPISIRRGFIQRRDYYVGSTGAIVSISATNGQIVDHSGSVNLNVDHGLDRATESAGVKKMEPELKGSVGKTEISVKPGSAEASYKVTSSSGVKFTTEEMIIAPIKGFNEVAWHIDTHRAEKAVRDFLIGNIQLHATFRWERDDMSGSIQARPSDICFFDSNKRPLSKRASILMRYALWKNDVKLIHVDGIEVAFTAEPTK